MVSGELRAVYFPIPKSACTLFSTFVALHSDAASDFNPVAHNVHSYRQQNERLHLSDFRVLTDDRYFRFTVIRDPYTRLVSAYVDKLVKPVREGLRWATEERCGKYSFEDVVESICKLNDAELDKHFRPQITFIRNVPINHIGLFEHLDLTFKVLKERFGIDIIGEVSKKVRSPKRTSYDQSAASDYVGNWTASELAEMNGIPPLEAFYNDDLREKIALRFSEDFDLYQRVQRQLEI